MSENKKVINATKSYYDGIEFRSDLEKRVYKKLISLGYKPEFEKDKFVLVDTLRPQKDYFYEGNPQRTKTGKISALDKWQYTPDFLLTFGNYRFYIEAKGHPNDVWPYKRKMFIRLIENMPNTYFFEVKTIRGLLKSIDEMKKIANKNE